MNVKWKTLAIALLSTGLLIGNGVAETKDQPPAPPAAPGSEPAAVAPKNIFQPSAIDPALVRQSMQARSEYEEMNRKITARLSKIYEENPEIRELQEKMRALHKKIDALLAEDKELNELKNKIRAIAPDLPAIPRKTVPPGLPNRQ